MRDRSGNPFYFFFKNKKIETDSPTRRGMPIKNKPQPLLQRLRFVFYFDYGILNAISSLPNNIDAFTLSG